MHKASHCDRNALSVQPGKSCPLSTTSRSDMFQDALHDQLFTQVPGDLKYQPTVGVETVKIIDIHHLGR